MQAVGEERARVLRNGGCPWHTEARGTRGERGSSRRGEVLLADIIGRRALGMRAVASRRNIDLENGLALIVGLQD